MDVIEKELPVDAIKVHAEIHALYGETRADEYERLEASVRQRGIIMPLEIASDDSPAFAGFLVDGEQRLRAAKAVGLRMVPARVRRFETPADVMLLLYALAARKSYTERQRALGSRWLWAHERAGRPSTAPETDLDELIVQKER